MGILPMRGRARDARAKVMARRPHSRHGQDARGTSKAIDSHGCATNPPLGFRSLMTAHIDGTISRG